MSYHHSEVTEQTIALAETCMEGLTHMQHQMKNGLHEATLQLYCNVLEAVYQIEASVNLVLKEEEQEDQLNQWNEVRDQFNARLTELADSFHESRFNDILPLIDRTIPELLVWKQTVQQYMSPKYLV